MEGDVLTIEGCVVLMCRKDAEDVVIPEGVTEIGKEAFQGCESLSSVVIPEGVTEIGKWAFLCCRLLTSVVIPEGVTVIGWGAFCGCESLTSVVIGEGVTKIGGRAFEGCESLSSVVIGEGVTKIGDYAFKGCKSLSSVEFGGTMAQWEAVKGKLELLEYVPAKTVKCSDGEWQKPVVLVEDGVLVKCFDESATSVTIPEGVTEIGEYAFAGCRSLSSVVIPESVKKIGEGAFAYCESLSSVVIPEGVTEIGAEAFSYCESLSSVVIPDGVTEIGRSAFYGCKSLSSVVIPEGVTEIGGYAFKGCQSLTSVVIGEGVTKIGWQAFNGCKSLKSIVIPSTVTGICNNAFRGCDAVENVVSASASYPFNEKTRKLYDATKKTKKVILVLTAAKEEAKKAKIERVQNASASAVLDSALAGRAAETAVVRDERCAYLRINAAVGGIEILLADSKAEKWMKTLPALLDLAETGADAISLKKFADGNALEDASRRFLSISRSGSVAIKTYGKKTTPVHLFIPEGATKIIDRAFRGLKSLKSVVIPPTVAEIGRAAFAECGNLQFAAIPASVTKISESAFSSCGELAEIAFAGTTTQWNAIEKGEKWSDGVCAKRVKCTDGEAEIAGE